jgi:hypothetical protein
MTIWIIWMSELFILVSYGCMQWMNNSELMLDQIVESYNILVFLFSKWKHHVGHKFPRDMGIFNELFFTIW